MGSCLYAGSEGAQTLLSNIVVSGQMMTDCNKAIQDVEGMAIKENGEQMIVEVHVRGPHAH